MKLREKKGVTLLLLVITIIVIVIIAGAVISGIIVTTENANLSNFANNISQIQDSARSMYILENKLPISNSAEKLTREDLLELIDVGNQNAFFDELNDNGEGKNAYFYQIDLNKVGADKTLIGTGKDGEDDIYVISLNSLKVYYLRGVEYDNNTYFSINSKLSNIVKLPVVEQDSSEVLVKTFQAVTVTKSNKGYDKDLGIKIIANMELGEKLKISYKGISEKTLLLPEGQTTIEVNNLSDLNSYIDEKFSDNEINIFNNLRGEDRVITLTKYYNNENIGNTKIDISNYDNVAPTFQISETKEYGEFFIVNGVATDNLGITNSGIAHVKYEFEGADGKNLKTITVDENGEFSFKVPKEVLEVKITVVDKVGNLKQESLSLI